MVSSNSTDSFSLNPHSTIACDVPREGLAPHDRVIEAVAGAVGFQELAVGRAPPLVRSEPAVAGCGHGASARSANTPGCD